MLKWSFDLLGFAPETCMWIEGINPDQWGHTTYDDFGVFLS